MPHLFLIEFSCLILQGVGLDGSLENKGGCTHGTGEAGPPPVRGDRSGIFVWTALQDPLGKGDIGWGGGGGGGGEGCGKGEGEREVWGLPGVRDGVKGTETQSEDVAGGDGGGEGGGGG